MAATAYIVLALCALANDGHIVGGADADIQNYAYQISLQYFGSHVCGGSIISHNAVLTAAHCTDGASASSMSVRAGSSIRDSGGSVHQIARILKHENYSSNTMDYDFALLEVKTPFTFGQGVQPVGLADNEPVGGDNAVISGWGTTSSGGSSPQQLQVVNVSIVDRNECINVFGSHITDRMICAGSDAGGIGTCLGDSGGPLLLDGNIAGILSWGVGCAAPTSPGVYANIANQRAWVIENSGI